MASRRSRLPALVRLLVSAVFVLSGIGKLIDIPAAGLGISQLFYLSQATAEVAAIALSLLELGVAALIWWKCPPLLMLVPIAFGLTLAYSEWQGADCGCFGSLPVLSEFPLVGHIVLILGLLAGLYYLSLGQQTARSGRLKAAGMGWLATAAIVISFLTLPFDNTPRAVVSSTTEVETVDLQGVLQAIESGSAMLIDARSPEQFLLGHLPGAINVYVDSDSIADWVERYALRDKALITYCASVHCDMAERLTARLRDLGCENVKIYPGGWEEWVMEGY